MDSLGDSSQAFDTDELRSRVRQYELAFRDLAHQLGGPASQMLDLVAQLRLATNDLDVQNDLGIAVPAALDRAEAVAMRIYRAGESISLAARLTEPSIIEPQSGEQEIREVVDLLDSVARESAVTIEPNKQVSWRLDVSDGEAVLDTKVRSDLFLLRHVFVNLLDNARKYSFEGTEIEGRLHDEGDEIVLFVASRGVVLEDDEVDRVFERGFRGRQARTTRGDGSGIGLWLAHELSSSMAHNLSIERNAGESITRFSLRLAKAGG